jgi:hypothetical protein
VISLHPPYRVECDRCGNLGPASDISPGLARAAAKDAGWGLVPGDKIPADICPTHTNEEN